VVEHRLTEQARRRTEQQLQQSQKMESLGTLAGGIAHDFNNILTAVYLNADRARKQMPADHPTLRNLDEIARAGTRAADLVRRIMAFGRQNEPVLKTMNLKFPVEESLELLRLSLPPRVSLETVLEEDIPNVAADSTQIHQILVNLGTNAIHAMEPHGGVLCIRLERFDVSASLSRQLTGLHEGPHVRLTVTDTGKGMEKPVLARIFDPFFTTKDPGVGTGLGLSVVHSIVNLHNGCITAHSEPNHGTVFHVYFPAIPADDQPTAYALREIPRGRGERILCVDDDPVILSACTEMLEDIGYSVTAFQDPRLAREEFRSRPRAFALLITDLSMPGMSGLDLIREIRMIAPDLPTVLSSGYLSALEAARARSVGVTTFVQKPNLTEELGAALADAFSRIRQERADIARRGSEKP
jgi:nitrogen-specific signal transduction histidine kinase/CheY-like chemotaxis protein